MALWHEQFPGKIYSLEYPRLVVEPELEVRTYLGWLDLPWESRCLDFHQNKSAVNTASLSQVRRPIYSESVEKWREFSDHLQPLSAALEMPGCFNPVCYRVRRPRVAGGW